ncbi:MAG TPA: RsmD family RNA methyltransferase, partial [Xanthomonadaceae bacterium]|nr:RsmD family RNA methyltransferase [Xanthomonadaceae bacterium]
MKAPGRIRIIGGSLRGSRLDVPDRAGLRPTPDRLRETLFNWLIPNLPGSRVLDLFAGTGALALEALSRGAASAVAVERDRELARLLADNAARLRVPAFSVVCDDARAWLR